MSCVLICAVIFLYAAMQVIVKLASGNSKLIHFIIEEHENSEDYDDNEEQREQGELFETKFDDKISEKMVG